MNIFMIDENPRVAARMMCNEHMKMILESAQLLSTMNRLMLSEVENVDLSGIYKPCHENHPSSVWLREDLKNVNWLLKHEDELFKENRKRYGKDHKSHAVTLRNIEIIRQNIDRFNLSETITSPKPAIKEQFRLPKAIPDDFYECLLTTEVSPSMIDVVTRYRYFYVKDKNRFATWFGKPPKWYTNGLRYLP